MSDDVISFKDLADMARLHYGAQKHNLSEALDMALEDVSGAVERLQKGGEITLKLKIAPKADGGVKIQPVLDTKAPQPSASEVGLFINKAGKLSLDDPDQENLPFDERIRAVRG